MAKVMISLPDSLLERIDMHVRAKRTTRSAFLRELAEQKLDADDDVRREKIRELLKNPGHHGGGTEEAIRQMRDSRR
jgi:metal-responsive CopG/Arc/MetJ family transcriptional regulator